MIYVNIALFNTISLSAEELNIKVFTSDANLKSLGELLSNDTSRKIIYSLMNNEMYTNELATKLDIRVSLVIHHLKKLEELNMLVITEKKIKRKGQEHRFFRITSDIFVTVNKNKEEVESKGFLQKIFKDSIKFVGIGIAGVATWFGTQSISTEPVSPPPPNLYLNTLVIKIPHDLLWSIVFTGIVISTTLIFIHLVSKKRKEED